MRGVAISLRRLEAGPLILLAALVGLANAQLAYLTHPLVPVALASGLGMAVLAFARPLLALYLAIALVPLELLSLSLGPAALSPAEAMLALTGIGWAASRLMRGQAPFSPSPLGKPLALLVLAHVPGIAIVSDPVTAGKVLVMWASFLLLYEMIVTEGGPDTVRNILFALALVGAIVGVVAILKSGGKTPELRGIGDNASGRAQGAFGSPNTFATFEALALPGALALALRGPAALRPVALGSFVVIFAGLAFSLSRGGLLAVVGALAMMLAWGPFRRMVVVVALITVIVSLSGVNTLGETQQAQVLTQRIESIGYSAEGVDPRFRVWQTSLRIFADHPYLGIGTNSFPLVAQRYGLLGANSLGTYEHAHNIVLTIAVELGLVGLAVLVWLGVALILVIARGLSRGPPEHRGLLFAVAAALAAIALQGMVDYTLRSNVIVAALFMLVGCAVVLSRGESHGSHH